MILSDMQELKYNLVNNVPDELKNINQWITWKKQIVDNKLVKLPCSGGYPIDVCDSNNHLPFDIVLKLLGSSDVDGAGFAFTDKYPICGIDYDKTDDPQFRELQATFYNKIDSYSEKSINGGCHQFIKGYIPSGINRKPIEIYPNSRFFVMTGQVTKQKSINYCQNELDELYKIISQDGTHKLVGGNTWNDEKAYALSLQMKYNLEAHSDAVIIERIFKSPKGKNLFQGRVDSYENEHDQALCDMLVNAGCSFRQAGRIFMMSGLVRDKIRQRKDYLLVTIGKAFNKIELAANYDFSQLPKPEVKKISVPVTNNDKNVNYEYGGFEDTGEVYNPFDTDTFVTGSSYRTFFDKILAEYNEKTVFPDGVVGDIARYIYSSAVYPIPAIAIAGALSLVAAIVGRNYQIKGQGLALYSVILAETGAGKNAVVAGLGAIIGKLIDKKPHCEKIIQRDFGSTQSLMSHLEHNPSLLWLNDECYEYFEELSNKRNPIAKQKRSLMTELLTANAKNIPLYATNYASKNTGSNTNIIKCPAVSYLGISQSQTFYRSINSNMFTCGFMPRFVVFEYFGYVSKPNRYHNLARVDDQLVNDCLLLVSSANVLKESDKYIEVQTTKNAQETLNKFREHANKFKLSDSKPIIKEVWSRADMLAPKIAALIAVGRNPHEPLINLNDVIFACNIVSNSIKTMLAQISSDGIGDDKTDLNQFQSLKRTIKQFFSQEQNPIFKNQIDNLVISHNHLVDELLTEECYLVNRYGSANAIKKHLDTLIAMGVIVALADVEAMAYGEKAKMYRIVKPWSLGIKRPDS